MPFLSPGDLYSQCLGTHLSQPEASVWSVSEQRSWLGVLWVKHELRISSQMKILGYESFMYIYSVSAFIRL